MNIEHIPQPEDSSEDDGAVSFSQEGGENVIFDKTSADERKEEIDKEQQERDKQLLEKLKDRPDMVERLREELKVENDPLQKKSSRQLLLRNISNAFKETMEESHTILEMNPGSLYSIFKNADEKQVEYWILQILEGYQELDATEKERRTLGLRGLSTLVNRDYSISTASKYLPELGIDLDTSKTTVVSVVSSSKKSGFFSKIKKLFGGR